MTKPEFTHAQHVHLQQLLEPYQEEYSLATVHGSISAMLACDHDKTHRDLIAADLLPQATFRNTNSQQMAEHPCSALFTSIHFQLTNTEFDYQLPTFNEDEPIEQINELIQWCEGFSLALAIFMDANCIDAEVKEICNTLAEVQNISLQQLAPDNIDQEEIEQISEYLRMAVVYVHSIHHMFEANNDTKEGTE